MFSPKCHSKVSLQFHLVRLPPASIQFQCPCVMIFAYGFAWKYGTPTIWSLTSSIICPIQMAILWIFNPFSNTPICIRALHHDRSWRTVARPVRAPQPPSAPALLFWNNQFGGTSSEVGLSCNLKGDFLYTFYFTKRDHLHISWSDGWSMFHFMETESAFLTKWVVLRRNSNSSPCPTETMLRSSFDVCAFNAQRCPVSWVFPKRGFIY